MESLAEASTSDLMDEALHQAIASAPAMTVALAAIFLVSRLFLNTWEKSEGRRDAALVERHKTYFAQLEQMQRQQDINTAAVVQAMDRGTSALRESNELMATVRELLRAQHSRT